MEPPDAATSPQASAEPAPLANLPGSTPTTGTSGLDGAAAPEPLRSDREVPTDSPHEATRDLAAKDPPRDPKELAGYELQVVIRAGEGPPATKGPEVNGNALDAARHKTEIRMTVDASQTRARFVLSSGFVLPAGTELRSRLDRYGHLLLLPGEDSYRVAEPGALRALLGERRLDVAPVSAVDVTATGEGVRRLNLRTRRVDLATRAAKATLELAAFRDAGEGGGLICRLLLDLMGGPPSASPCATDEVPLHAELRWTTQGALAFDVTAIARRTDLAVQDLAAPPSSTAFVPLPPPMPQGEALLGKGDLAAFRNGPVDVTPPGDAAPPPEAGLLLANFTDALRVAWVDGVPVAWVAPGGRVPLPSLIRGRYLLQWRTFLGDAWEPPQTVIAPGRSEIGTP